MYNIQHTTLIVNIMFDISGYDSCYVSQALMNSNFFQFFQNNFALEFASSYYKLQGRQFLTEFHVNDLCRTLLHMLI